MGVAQTPHYPLRGDARLSYYLQRLAARLPALSWRDYQLVAQPRAALPCMPKAYHVMRASDAQLRPLCKDFHLSRAALHWRRAQQMEALLAYRGDQPVGLMWISAQDFEEDEAHLRFCLPAHGAWDTGLYIIPRERHRRAWAALWAGAAQWMAERDITTCYSRINAANAASRASHQRMGAVMLGRIGLLSLGPWLWAPRLLALPLRPSHAPRLDVRLPPL